MPYASRDNLLDVICRGPMISQFSNTRFAPGKRLTIGSVDSLMLVGVHGIQRIVISTHSRHKELTLLPLVSWHVVLDRKGGDTTPLTRLLTQWPRIPSQSKQMERKQLPMTGLR